MAVSESANLRKAYITSDASFASGSAQVKQERARAEADLHKQNRRSKQAYESYPGDPGRKRKGLQEYLEVSPPVFGLVHPIYFLEGS